MLGVTHLNHKQVVDVERILPVLTEFCAAVIEQRSGGKLTIQSGHFPALKYGADKIDEGVTHDEES